MSIQPTPNIESSEATEPAADNEASSSYRIPEWLLTKLRGSPEACRSLRNPAI